MAQPTVAAARPMDFHVFLESDLEPRAEYVDGKVLVSPPPSFAHQKICQRLTRLLEDSLIGAAEVVAAAGWVHQSRQLVRIPDIMVLSRPPDGPVVTETPMVVVEVLSTNRADDLVRKSHEYLRAGVGQYWIVDPRDAVLDAYENQDGWRLLAHLDAAVPSAHIEILAGVTVELDLAHVLG